MTYVLADCSLVKTQGGFLFSRNLIVQIHKIQFGMARTYYYVQFKLQTQVTEMLILSSDDTLVKKARKLPARTKEPNCPCRTYFTREFSLLTLCNSIRKSFLPIILPKDTTRLSGRTGFLPPVLCPSGCRVWTQKRSQPAIRSLHPGAIGMEQCQHQVPSS